MALHRHLRTPFLTAAVLCAYPNTVLANYTYDALGRRITFNDPVAPTATRYYYDGQSVIEERSAADTRVRYHVNGSQYIDERVATFTDASSAFAYYLGSNNFSIAGTGNADGSIVERLDYSSTGDFAGGGPGGARSTTTPMMTWTLTCATSPISRTASIPRRRCCQPVPRSTISTRLTLPTAIST